MIAPVRRVLSVSNRDGTVRIVEDGPSPHVHTLPGMPGDLGLTDLWRTDPQGTPDDAADGPLAVAPAVGGSLFRIVQFPPDAELPTTDTGEPALFWHSTDTVDYNVLLSGKLAFLIDGGEAELRPGDALVVQGGRHAWSNRTQEPAVLVAVSIDATRHA